MMHGFEGSGDWLIKRHLLFTWLALGMQLLVIEFYTEIIVVLSVQLFLHLSRHWIVCYVLPNQIFIITLLNNII